MKNFYPLQVIDLSYQVDHSTPKIIQQFEDNRGANKEIRLFVLLMSQTEIKMLSDGNNLTSGEVELI